MQNTTQDITRPLPSLQAPPPRLSRAAEAALVQAYQASGDPAAKARLLASYQPFVRQLASSYAGYGHDSADLMQAANVGLLRALEAFEPGHGTRVLTYAVHQMRAELNEYVLRNDRLVFRYTSKARRKLFFNRGALRDASGDWRPAADVAAELEVPVRAVEEVQAHLSGADTSTDLPEGEFGPASYLRSPDDPAGEVERADWQAKRSAALEAALAGLSERERDIIQRRWVAEVPATLQALGASYGVSAERIRQLEKRALQKLRGTLAQAGWEAAA